MKSLFDRTAALSILFVLLLLFSGSIYPGASASSVGSVKSDRASYLSGSTVLISGNGFGPAKELTILVTDPSGVVSSGLVVANATGGYIARFSGDGRVGVYGLEATDGVTFAYSAFNVVKSVYVSVSRSWLTGHGNDWATSTVAPSAPSTTLSAPTQSRSISHSQEFATKFEGQTQAPSILLEAPSKGMGLSVSSGPRASPASGPSQSTQSGEPMIWTNKADYAPHSVVTISGSGFLPNTYVTVSVTNPDQTFASWPVLTNGYGNFVTYYQLNSQAGTYYVSATDGTYTATTTFTDATHLKYFTLDPTQGNVVAGVGGTLTSTATITCNGEGGLYVTLSAETSPTTSAITFVASPNPVYCDNNVVTSTITITVDSTITGGAYTLKITATPGSGNEGHEEIEDEFVISVPSLSLSPTSGLPGQAVTLSGSYYSTGTSYGYCLSTSSSSTASCLSGTTGSFTTDSGGSIPAGTIDTVPGGTPPGTYCVLVYQGTTVFAYADFIVKASPTISTVLSGTTIDAGQSVTDSATLTGAFPGAGGTVQYEYFSSLSCTGTPVNVGGTVTVSSGVVPGSAPQSFSSAGSYGWKAVYSGDVYDQAATSACEPLTVNTALAAGPISPGSPAIDNGQAITLTANPSGGTPTYGYQWYSGSSPACSSDTTPLGTASSQAVSPTANTYYCYTVTDSSGGTPAAGATSATDLVVVNPALAAGAITPPSPSIDNGQSILLTSHATGGASPLAYQWYADGSCTTSIPGASSATYSATPSSTTTYSYRVTDSAYLASSRCSPGDTVTANPALAAGSITPSSLNIDSGQTITLTAHPTGGTAPLSYQWHTGTGCTAPIPGATSLSYAASPTSSTTYYFMVSDSSSAGAMSACSPGDVVTVSASLATPTISPAAPSIDTGQAITLTVSWTGGTGPYTVRLYSSPTSSCSTGSTLAGTNAGVGGTSTAFSVSPGSNTYYCATVVDSAYSPFTTPVSGADMVTVNSALSAGAPSPSSPTIDNGQSITLAANPSGGTTPYSYQWYSGSSVSCSSDITALGTVSTQAVTPSSGTYYCYRVTDSAVSPESALSATDHVSVNPTLVAGSITPSSPSIDSGQTVLLTSHASGGTAPLTYQWYSDGTCTTAISLATGTSYSASPSSTTTYTYRVTDSAYSPVGLCSGADTVTVYPPLAAGAITPSSPTINSGNSVTLMSHPSGGTPPLTYQWYSDGTCVTPIPGATSSTYSASPVTTTTYSYRVTDSASPPMSACSAGDTVTVYNPPSAGAITPASPTIDSGQSIALTSHASGGTPPLTYQWYADGTCTTAISGATGTTYLASPTVTTTYTYQVTDSSLSPTPVCSSPDAVTVNPALAAGGITPPAPTIDSGQTILLASHASGGTPPLSYQWYSDGSCGSAIGGATSVTYSASPPSSTTYSYRVSDSAYSPVSVCSAGDTVSVNPPLVIGSVTPASPTIDSGQSVTLSASPSGGTIPYSYQWYSGSSPSCSSDTTLLGTGSTQVVSPTSGTYYCYRVSDGANTPESGSSAADLVSVNPALVAGAITPASPAIDSGQSLTLVSHATGGTSPLSYQWYSDGTCITAIPGATSGSYVASPTVTTTYSYQVTDSAYSPVSQCSPGDTVAVSPPITAGAITPASPTIDNGQTLVLTSNASGGTGPLSYQWYSDGTCTSAIGGATSTTFSASPTATTTYSYRVTDSSSLHASACSAGDTVTVNPALTAGAISPASPTIDSGQTVTLSSAATGGTAPLTYQWYSDGACTTPVPGATSSSYSASPVVSTTYSYKVTDSAYFPASACSAGDTVTVNPALTAGAITPSSPSIDSGQTVILVSHASGGTAPLAYQWYSDGACGSSIGSATSTTYSASPSSTTTYSYRVTDSAHSPESSCSTGDTVSVNPALVAGAITPSTPTINSGQTITLTAHPSGGTTPYSYQWYQGSSPVCASDTTALGTASTQMVSPTANTYYCYTVTDSAMTPESQTSATDLVTVNAGLVAGAITPASPAIDNGQSITLASHASGGTPPYSYQWFTGVGCSSPVPGATSSSYSATPGSTTTYYYQVTDSASTPASQCSAGDTVTVNPALTAGAITPASPNIDVGQTVTLTANPSGGTSPYSYQWYSDGTCSSSIPGATVRTFAASPTTTTTYSYRVTDSAYAPSTACSSGDVVTVNAALSAGAITPSAPTIDSGQMILLTSNPSGGTLPYAYQWYSGTDPNCSLDTALLSTAGTQLVGPSTGTYYCYSVTDSAFSPASQSSPTDLVTVNPTLTAGPITPASPAIDNGQSITLSSAASGGTPPLTYQWYSDGTCSSAIPGATLTTLTVSPASTTTYSYKVTDSAYFPASMCSPGDTVTVNAALNVGAISPSSPTIDSGQSILLSAGPSGGTIPYSFQWYSDGSCTTAIAAATSSSYSASPGSTTTYSYRVTDSAFAPQSGCSPGDTVTVNPALVAGAITPASPNIETGHSVTLTASPSGGTGPLSYQWYSDGACSSLIPSATSSTYVASPSSATTYSYKVTDSAYVPVSRCSPGDLVTVAAGLAAGPITPNTPSIDNGQSLTLTANPSGGTGPYTYQWHYGTSPVCSLDTNALGTASTQMVSPTANTYYCYTVTDSASSSQSSSTDLVTVNPALVAGTITPSSPTIDSGDSVILTSHASGGTPPLTYQWYTGGTCSSAIPSANLPTLLASPASTSVYSYRVTDSAAAPASACSPGDTVTVNSALVAGAITPTAPTITSGGPITLFAHPSGGTGPYAYQWYSGSGCTSPILGANAPSYDATPPSTATFSYRVTDSASSPGSRCSPDDVVTVSGGPVVSISTLNLTPIDSGESWIILASFRGGTGPFTCTWLVTPPGATAYSILDGPRPCTSPTSISTGTLTTVGLWAYQLTVMDSEIPPVSGTAGLGMVVNPVLTPSTVSSNPGTISPGQSSTISSTAFGGGTFPFYCQWLQREPGDSSFSPLGETFSCNEGDAPAISTGPMHTKGTWMYELQVTDSAGLRETVTSNAASMVVDPPADLALSTMLKSSSVTIGALARASATLSGVSPNAGGTVTYSLYSGSSCNGKAIQSSTGVVKGGVVPDSAGRVFKTVGAYSWLAKYSGDANNPPTIGDCESFTVKYAPSLTALLWSASSAQGGVAVGFKASLTKGLKPGGSVVFEYFTGGACGGNPVAFLMNTATISRGAAYSSGIVFSPGTYSLIASYGGDGANFASSSPCLTFVVASGAALACASGPASIGSRVSCNLILANQMARGAVTWSATGAGNFVPRNTCKIVSKSGCGINYLSPGWTTLSFTANYGGDTKSGPMAVTIVLNTG